MKKVIRLTENDLHRIVNRTVKNVLNENFDKWFLDRFQKNIDDNPSFNMNFGRIGQIAGFLEHGLVQ